MKQTTFEIRAYGVGELAELYSPHMSQHSFPTRRSSDLELGFRPGIRSFTPRQVECIVEHLGEP